MMKTTEEMLNEVTKAITNAEDSAIKDIINDVIKVARDYYGMNITESEATKILLNDIEERDFCKYDVMSGVAPEVRGAVSKFADKYGTKYRYDDEKNSLYMTMYFDDYNAKGFKLVFDGDYIKVSHIKDGIINDMRWPIFHIARWVEDNYFYDEIDMPVDLTKVNKASKTNRDLNLFDKVLVANGIKISVNVGCYWDGSRHDHGCKVMINKHNHKLGLYGIKNLAA